MICDVCGDARETSTMVELGGEPFLAALAHEAVAERQRCLIVQKNLLERLNMLRHQLHELVTHASLE